MKPTNWQLAIIISFVTVLLILCIWYVIQNRGNEKIIELSFKSLILPVVFAFGLFLIELIKPIPEYNSKTVLTLTEDPLILNNLVSHIDGTIDRINLGTMDITTFIGKNKNSLPFTNDKNRIEIVELAILHIISRRYSQHWQIDYEEGEPFFDGTSLTKSKKNNSEKITIELTEDKLHKIYPEDHLIQKINSDLSFVIPKQTHYSVSGNDYERNIRFRNKYISAILSIEKIGSATLPHIAGKTAALIRKRLNLPVTETYRLDFFGYLVKVNVKPNRLRKWHPRTVEQTEWLMELFDHLEKSLGWDKIMDKMVEIE